MDVALLKLRTRRARRFQALGMLAGKRGNENQLALKTLPGKQAATPPNLSKGAAALQGNFDVALLKKGVGTIEEVRPLCFHTWRKDFLKTGFNPNANARIRP